MNINSIYPEMTDSAKLIPLGVNAKIVIRHSIRESLKGVESPDEVPLTKEGRDLAISFGKGLVDPIGKVYSSNVERCIETARCIIEGNISSSNIPVTLVDMRKFYASEIQESYKTFVSENSGKNVVVKLSNGNSLSGFLTIKDIALNQLKFFFNTGGQLSHWDIYCTHDFQIICLISAIFKNINNIDDVKDNWPNMLEGVLLWGSLNDFYCAWRNSIRHVENQNL